jgi:hypothetical protein
MKNKDQGKRYTLKRGEVVHPWGSTIAICTSNPYEDPRERKKQIKYWKEKHNMDLQADGKLIKVSFLKFEGENLNIGEKEYIFPVEVIKWRGVERFKKKLKKV